MQYKSLVFSGGGALACAYIGALEELDSRGILKNIDNYAGSSVGSLFASLLACGASVQFLNKELKKLNLKELKDDSVGILRDIYRICSEYGYCKGNKLLNLCEKYICELTGNPKYTFNQLKIDKNKIMSGMMDIEYGYI